jgi:rhodanese-related sulfurtransferase
MPRFVSPAQLRTLIAQRSELAVLDVREEGVSARRRLFYSSVAPVRRLGLLIERLVPRRGTPVVLVDTNGEHTTRAAALLARWGYTDVSILEGGVDGWANAGYEVFSGTNVPGKAFGEVIEHELHTPNIDAETLKARQDAGDDLVVLDSRPFGEFNTMNIPGGIDCAGAELVYRALAAAPSPETLIVVNCAGRTRSILGAQSLINAGVPNPVAALTGGSMSWLLAGLELEHGEKSAPRRVPTPTRSPPHASLRSRPRARPTCRSSIARRSPRWSARRANARCIASTCAIRSNTKRAIRRAGVLRRAASSCRRPTNTSAHCTRAWCCATTMACAPA